MVLSLYTAYNTRPLRFPVVDGVYVTPDAKEVRRALGLKRGRRALELAFVVVGVVGGFLGGLGLAHVLSWGGGSYAALGVGGVLALDGVISMAIDFARRKKRPLASKVVKRGSADEKKIPGTHPIRPKLKRREFYTQCLSNPHVGMEKRAIATVFYKRKVDGAYSVTVRQGLIKDLSSEAANYHNSLFSDAFPDEPDGS